MQLPKYPIGQSEPFGPGKRWINYWVQSPKTGRKIVMALAHVCDAGPVCDKIIAAIKRGETSIELSAQELLPLIAVDNRPTRAFDRGFCKGMGGLVS